MIHKKNVLPLRSQVIKRVSGGEISEPARPGSALRKINIFLLAQQMIRQTPDRKPRTPKLHLEAITKILKQKYITLR